MRGTFQSMGQNCTGAERFIVQVRSQSLASYWSQVGNILSPWLLIGHTFAMRGTFQSMGQNCTGAERFIVQVRSQSLASYWSHVGNILSLASYWSHVRHS
jgi:hypothetical protein